MRSSILDMTISTAILKTIIDLAFFWSSSSHLYLFFYLLEITSNFSTMLWRLINRLSIAVLKNYYFVIMAIVSVLGFV